MKMKIIKEIIWERLYIFCPFKVNHRVQWCLRNSLNDLLGVGQIEKEGRVRRRKGGKGEFINNS